jgi:hypothetical protein
VPVNRKNCQICSRLKHCSSNFHNTMHKVIHLYGKNYGKNRPPIFLLERSTQSREGERGGRLTGGGSHGGEGALPGSTDQRRKETPGRQPEGREATAATAGVGNGRERKGDARWGRKAVALTSPAGPPLKSRPQRQCRPAEAGSAGATGSAGVKAPAVPPNHPKAQTPSKIFRVLV